ncbi:MAG: PIN domain-containing protein [Acidimicrobiales bacterium]
MLIVDTGPLVAAADRTDRHHHACLELLEIASGPLVTTAMVVAEAVYLLTRELGPHAEPAFYDAIINGDLTVEALTKAVTPSRR